MFVSKCGSGQNSVFSFPICFSLMALTNSQCEAANSYSLLEPFYLSRERRTFSSKTVKMKESKESDSSWFSFVQYTCSEYFKHTFPKELDLIYFIEERTWNSTQKVKWDWYKPQTKIMMLRCHSFLFKVSLTKDDMVKLLSLSDS